MSGYEHPFSQQMPHLEYVLRGIKSDEVKRGKGDTRTRLPITPKVLRYMRASLMRDPSSHDNIMIWAACCTCFLGFLRSGEIVAPSVLGYKPSVHLSFGDVTLDSRL